MFAKYDTSKSGFLGRKEVAMIIKDVYATIGRTSEVTAVEINQFMSLLDKDGDGRISKKELTSYFQFMVNH